MPKLSEKERTSIVHERQPLVNQFNDFIGVLDGIIYGIKDGQPFHNGKQDWNNEDLVRFFRTNSWLFKNLSDKMEQFASIMEKRNAKTL